MKLSSFFAQIDTLWKTTSLFQLGVWVVFIGVVIHGSHQYASRQHSTPKVYLIFCVTLVITIGALENLQTVNKVLTNSFAICLIAGCIGVGRVVHQRLIDV